MCGKAADEIPKTLHPARGEIARLKLRMDPYLAAQLASLPTNASDGLAHFNFPSANAAIRPLRRSGASGHRTAASPTIDNS
jgi:hypothetical protein